MAKALNTHGKGPIILSSCGALLIILETILHFNILLIIGIVLLLTASVWNALPKRISKTINWWFSKLITNLFSE